MLFNWPGNCPIGFHIKVIDIVLTCIKRSTGILCTEWKQVIVPYYCGNKLHYEHCFKLIVFNVNCSLVLCYIVNLWIVYILEESHFGSKNPCRIFNNLSGITLCNSPLEDTESKYFLLDKMVDSVKNIHGYCSVKLNFVLQETIITPKHPLHIFNNLQLWCYVSSRRCWKLYIVF